MLCVIGVYLRDMIFLTLHLNASHLSVCSLCKIFSFFSSFFFFFELGQFNAWCVSVFKLKFASVETFIANKSK